MVNELVSGIIRVSGDFSYDSGYCLQAAHGEAFEVYQKPVMKVVVWSALGRIGTYATGVGKHALHMACGLSAWPGWETRLLLSSDLWARDQTRAESSLMDAIPAIRLPFSRRMAEALWRTIRHPKLDRWLGDADWVYCPKELYVPVRQVCYAVTVHDLYRLEPAYRHLFPRVDWRWRWLLQRAVDEADQVLAVSKFTKERLVALLGAPPEKIRVVGNGVEEGFFAVAEQDPAAVSPYPGQRYVLAVGGVTHKKGGAALLATARELERIAPRLKLVVTGPIAREFERQVADQKNLLSLKRGFPDPEMQRLVRGAQAALILSEYEGFGIPALEAIAAGVPVIAARRAALPEVVGDAGLLVEPTRPTEVVQTVVDLLADRDYRETLVARGRAHAESYRWPRSVEKLCAALEELR